MYGDRYYVSVFGELYDVLDAATGGVPLESRLAHTILHKTGETAELFPILVSETYLFAGASPGRVLAFRA